MLATNSSGLGGNLGSEQKQCPECGGEMEAGFVADVAESGVLQQTWVRGWPEKRWFGGLKVDRKDCVPVQTNRCKKCGF